MPHANSDAALIQVLAIRFERIRLPVALDLQNKVNQGQLLNDIDIMELESFLNDISVIKPLLERHSEWQPLASRMASLYHAITTRALENEQQA